jgi:5-methylcytosine-specific restriction endonuclease McrA
MAIHGNPVAWENFYKTARWRRLRKHQLKAEPLCRFCLERGIVTPANVVDHVVLHKGNCTEFVTGKPQSLCEHCHNSTKRQIELRGYRRDVGIDGYPTDLNHPFNRAG